jgi:site-specific DNA recombinase
VHVPDPRTKKYVRKAFELYLDPNQSVATVTEQLKIMGLVTRKGRPYAKSKIQKMLTNPFYIGINRFNGKDYPGAQKTLISKSLFEAVQEKLQNKRPIKFVKHNPVFKNVMYCEDCSGMITWEKHKNVYYGACQRRNESCMGKKYIREDKAEEEIKEILEKLICPSEKIMAWVIDTLRSRQQENTTDREEVIATLQSKIARVERMEETLYDDKLSGLISPEKYLTKRQQLIQEKNELDDQLSRLDESSELRTEYGMTLLELSQKAAKIYANKPAEQKRLIMSEMFHSSSASGNVVSVKLTKLAQAIAEKSQETNDKLNGPKDDERETKNDPDNSGDEGHSDIENELQSSWLGRRDSNPRMLGPEPSALPLGDSPRCATGGDYTKY